MSSLGFQVVHEPVLPVAVLPVSTQTPRRCVRRPCRKGRGSVTVRPEELALTAGGRRFGKGSPPSPPAWLAIVWQNPVPATSISLIGQRVPIRVLLRNRPCHYSARRSGRCVQAALAVGRRLTGRGVAVRRWVTVSLSESRRVGYCQLEGIAACPGRGREGGFDRRRAAKQSPRGTHGELGVPRTLQLLPL